MKLKRLKDADRKGYVIINNHITKDRGLSLKAKGFLLTIFALPDEWDFTIKGIESILLEGRHTVYAVINDLIAAGYCRRVKVYQKGKIDRYEYHFVEEPGTFDLFTENLKTASQETGVLLSENLQTENLNTENLLTGFRPQYKKQLINKTKNEINRESGEARARTRGTRLGEDFALTDSLREWAAVKAPLVDLDLETEKFRNYYLSAAGSRGVKLDWDAAWRTWVLKAIREYGNGKNQGNGYSAKPGLAETLRGYDRLAEKYGQ